MSIGQRTFLRAREGGEFTLSQVSILATPFFQKAVNCGRNIQTAFFPNVFYSDMEGNKSFDFLEHWSFPSLSTISSCKQGPLLSCTTEAKFQSFVRL
eukprot:gb/GEZJ01006359.1/.p1 GENE.gb/GEZJ01006359.1/~~gb/GEZJ01006359.1/.p1  ORF type:complete len:107 (-),score=6.07 gb/GEZJ01006359.1/:158-448(-)